MTEPRAMTGRVTLGNGEVRDLASPGRRLVARIIDGAIILVVVVVFAVVGIASIFAGSEAGDEVVEVVTSLFAGGAIFMAILFVIYEPTFIATRGQTLGKMAMRIKVIRADDGGIPGWGKALGRWVLPGLLVLIPVVGGLLSLLVYLSLLWDDRRQGWHDKMGTTVVVDA